MKLITSGTKLSATLVELINQHEKIQFAVAWATNENSVYKALKKHEAKIRKSVIGIDGYITKPDVLFDFVKSNKVKFVIGETGVFHPKIYLFQTGKDWDLIMGSANMTSGGFGKNTEIMVHLSSANGKKKLYQKSQEAIKDYWENSEKMTSVKAENYSGLYTTHRAKNPQLKPKKKKAKAHINTLILPMSWASFYKAAVAVRKHTIEDRFVLLNAVKNSFDKNEAFLAMGLDERRMIAGLPNELNDYTGLFGSMDRAAHTHKWADHIDNNNPLLSQALDAIPVVGQIEKNHFQNYSELFQKATGYKNGKGTFTRLLAMKRPDTFVCLTNTNMEALCDDFGIAASTMTYKKYWDEIIERLTQSVWWNAKIPKKAAERSVWNNRAALLDAIYYEP